MVLFLTSSPTGDLDGKYVVEGIDNRNGFLDDLKSYWHNTNRVLYITATPNDFNNNDNSVEFFSKAFKISGLGYECFDLLDQRYVKDIIDEIKSYDVIILGGGHVPTQNAFFNEIGLRKKFIGYEGLVIGISAGSMNCADTVYAQPEEMGEAINPYYQRFIRGLGLTTINVCPHYQMVKNKYLDGLHQFWDISCLDSEGKTMIALVDGSYIKIDQGRGIVKGEAYKLYPNDIVRI